MVTFFRLSSTACRVVQDEFSAVITKALVTLVHGLETKFDSEMAAMTRVPWGTLESVGDQSEYVPSPFFITQFKICLVLKKKKNCRTFQLLPNKMGSLKNYT